MSAVIQRAPASADTLRSQSVGRRPAGSGTVTVPWTPPTSGPTAKSPASSAPQSAPTSTSSSRKTIQGISGDTARQPALRAAAGPRPPAPPLVTTGSRPRSASGGARGKPGAGLRRAVTAPPRRGGGAPGGGQAAAQVRRPRPARGRGPPPGRGG